MSQKVTIYVTETLKYNREIEVLLPDDMEETEFRRALDKAERFSNRADEVVYELKRFGIEQNGFYDNDMECPDDFDVEIDEYDYSEENKL